MYTKKTIAHQFEFILFLLPYQKSSKKNVNVFLE